MNTSTPAQCISKCKRTRYESNSPIIRWHAVGKKKLVKGSFIAVQHGNGKPSIYIYIYNIYIYHFHIFPIETPFVGGLIHQAKENFEWFCLHSLNCSPFSAAWAGPSNGQNTLAPTQRGSLSRIIGANAEELSHFCQSTCWQCCA